MRIPVFGALSALASGVNIPSIESLSGRRRSLITPSHRRARLGSKACVYCWPVTIPPPYAAWSMRTPTPIVLETETFLR